MKRLFLIALTTLSIALFAPVQSQAATGAYAALGDSIAAGAGLSTADPLCDRSGQSYPYMVSASIGVPLNHFACSGAKADEGIYDAQENRAVILPAQIDQAFTGGTPAVISMTIGANDARWTQFIRQCYYIRCGYDVDTARFATYLVDLKLELNIILAKIHTMSNGTPPKVFVTGYYDPFSGGVCSATGNLSADEVAWLRTRSEKLNTAISGTVGKYSYAHFVPVDFTGHDLCSSNPWIQGASEAAPFHPTAEGQQAIANAVTAAYTANQPATSSLSYRERFLNWYRRFSND